MSIADEERWKRNYDSTSHRNPRELMLQAMRRFGDGGTFAGMAVDLGCGVGIETLELLRHDWHVFATDYQPQAIRRLLEHVPSEIQSRLTARVLPFEAVQIPTADMIWAGLSLPFCPREHLPHVLNNIVAALKPGGRFAGDFFGPRHEWADEAHVTALTGEEIKTAFNDLHLEYWMEHEGERPTTHGITHWHGYGAIYRKA